MLNSKPERISKSEADLRLSSVGIAVQNLAIAFGDFIAPEPVNESPVAQENLTDTTQYDPQSYQQRLDALAMLQRAFEEQNNEIQ